MKNIHTAAARKGASNETAPSAGAPLSRRRFFQALGGGAAVLAGGALFGCAFEQAHADEMDVIGDYDVVVVGGGGAGVTAAGKAAEAGARTVLLEKMASLAGSSSICLGGFYGADTVVQRNAGIEDDPEGLLEYFMTRGGDKLDYDMQKLCAYEFGNTVNWLAEELDVPFQEKPLLKGTDTIPRQAKCANSGMDALNAVTAWAQAAGAEFHFGTEAVSLATDKSGRVNGVIVRQGGRRESLYRAKKVIVATGGFCRNEEMVAEYLPDYVGVYTEVGVGCTGEGLQMGLDLGAAYLGHGGTNGILACPAEAGQSKLINKKALWVTSSGERFANEAGQTHDIYYQVAHFDDQSFYAVYDQALVDTLEEKQLKALEFGLEKGYFAQADTAAEAAEILGVNGAATQASLDAYNAMVRGGADTQYGKKAEELVSLEQGPFYVLTMGVCTHGSFGGYHVNTDFQVLDTNGAPIENLYSAGEVCCGSFIYDDYPAGGCGLNWAYTSGRLAGAGAAAAALA